MELRVDTTKIFDDFQNHFEKENNKRILFSAPFGSGKSTFLTEFFERSELYNVFKIYPVSYSISHNEDIFELIKYDILFQLIEDHEELIDLKNEEYSPILAFQFRFLKEMSFTPVLFNLMKLIDKTGSSNAIESIIDNVKHQYKSFKTKFKDEEADIENYMLNQYSKKGSPRECDLMSLLIKELLNRIIKSNTIQSDKENVLIIDDLDRLDPDHIFRLFNIFSVNFGKEEIQNKFGFDKIIFVCDLDNIRNIYTHKYGKNVDFEGYIDKFYSICPYKFDLNQLLNNYTKQLIMGFNLSPLLIDFGDERELEYHPIYIVLKAIINNLIIRRKINLRTLINSNYFALRNKQFSFNTKERKTTDQFYIISILQILETLYGGTKYLSELFDELKEISNKNTLEVLSNGNLRSDDEIYNNLVEICIPFIIHRDKLINDINSIKSSSDRINLIYPIYNLNIYIDFYISINYRYNRGEYNYEFSKFYVDKERSEEIQVNPYQILLITLQRCISLHII